MMRTVAVVLVSVLTLTLHLSTRSDAADAETINRLEKRLDKLEQDAASLRSDLNTLKSRGDSEATDSSAENPENFLFGTWACTNNIFNYELSLLKDGIVITKELSSGQTQQGQWVRRGADDILVTQSGYGGSGLAKNMRVRDLREDRLTLEEPNTQSTYDCIRLSKE